MWEKYKKILGPDPGSRPNIYFFLGEKSGRDYNLVKMSKTRWSWLKLGETWLLANIKQLNFYVNVFKLQEKHEKNMRLEKQLNALNSRFTNLQKISSVKPNDQPKSATVCGSRNALQIKNTSKTPAQTHIQQQQTLVHNANVLEAFALLLDWIGQVHLKESLNFSLPLSGNNQILDKSCRLLPLLAELIIHLNSSSITNLVANSFQKYHLAFLEFIYWSLLHYDFSTNSAKGSSLCVNAFCITVSVLQNPVRTFISLM